MLWLVIVVHVVVDLALWLLNFVQPGRDEIFKGLVVPCRGNDGEDACQDSCQTSKVWKHVKDGVNLSLIVDDIQVHLDGDTRPGVVIELVG